MKWYIALVTVVATTALPAPEPENANFSPKVIRDVFGFGANTKGGEGGAVWTVWDAWALRAALNSSALRNIYVKGRIDLTVLFNGSPGVMIPVGSFKTIMGGDANAEIFGGGLLISNQENVIIRNLKMNNAISYAAGEQPDGNGGIVSQIPGEFASINSIYIERSKNVWVDHCEFSDDPWNSAATPDDKRRHDGLITIRNSSNYITISNNIFRNHNRVMLIGHETKDTGTQRVIINYNWFQGTTQMNPQVVFGQVHILNNLYTDIRSYGIGAGRGSQIYAERNAFLNTKRAWTSTEPNQPASDSHFLGVQNTLINSDTGISSNVGLKLSRYYDYNVTVRTGENEVEAYVRRIAGTL